MEEEKAYYLPTYLHPSIRSFSCHISAYAYILLLRTAKVHLKYYLSLKDALIITIIIHVINTDIVITGVCRCCLPITNDDGKSVF